MILSIIWILLGLVFLYYGAEILVKGSVALAVSSGMSHLVIGLTVVAFGTSAPELAVCLKAAWNGSDGIALGNVIGSNIANIALILGISAMVKPISIHGDILKHDSPLLILASSILIFMLMDGELSRWEGATLLSGVICYTFFKVRSSSGDPRQIPPHSEDSAVVEEAGKEEASEISIPINLALILAGIILLVAGGNFLVSGASDLARLVGVSEAVIGLTIVAVGTSVPELATSIVATLRNHADIALGNAIGSSLFNILAILGTTSLIFPLNAMGITGIDLAVFLGVSMVILPAMRTGFRLGRMEGVFLTAGYMSFLVYLGLHG